MRPDRARLILLVSLAAGLADAMTGLLLVSVPSITLGLFGAAMPGPGDDILMRFVGAFVLGVGLAYLWGLSAREPRQRGLRLQGVWGATAAVRTCIALFTLLAVFTGRLETAWLVVTASDATLAAIQIRGLSAAWFVHD